MDLRGSWAPFGRGLGRFGASLGCSWTPLGRFGSVQNRVFFKHWAKMVSKRPSGLIFDPFGEGLGGVLGGFGEAFGALLAHLGRPGVELASHLVRMLYVSCCPIFCYRNPRAASLRPAERHNTRGFPTPRACWILHLVLEEV